MDPWPDKRPYFTLESQLEDEGSLSYNVTPSLEWTLL